MAGDPRLLRTLKRRVVEAPAAVQNWLALSRQLIAAGDDPAAERSLEAAIRHHPEFPGLRALLIDVSVRLNHADRALHHALVMAQMGLPISEHVLRAAALLIAGGMYDQGCAVLDQLVGSVSERPELLDSIALLFVRAGKVMRATDLWKRHAVLQPNQARHAYACLIDALLAAGEREQAARLYRQKLGLQPPPRIRRPVPRPPSPAAYRMNICYVMGDAGALGQVEGLVHGGSGKLTLSGNAAPVLTEAAQLAFSHLKANQAAYGVHHLEQLDLHLNFPFWAIRKDGGSAGLPVACLLWAMAKGVPVRTDVACTGELQADGNVLPVGGIPQKLLGAYNAGMSMVVLPSGNFEELQQVDPEIKFTVRPALVRRLADAIPLIVPGDENPMAWRNHNG